MLTYYVTPDNPVVVSRGLIIFFMILIAVVAVVFYVLRSLAIHKMAKKQNLSKSYLAWIPFLWSYLVTKLAGKIVFFGRERKNFALFTVIIFTIAEVVSIAYLVITYLPIVGYFLQGGSVFYAEGQTSISGVQYFLNTSFYTSTPINIGYAYSQTMIKFMIAMTYISSILDIVSAVVIIGVYFSFFKKYYPNHYILASIFSFMGLFAPFAFAVRNKEPVDFNEYMRAKYQRFYNMNAQNGFMHGQNVRRNNVQDSPFKDFEQNNQDSEPFGEFNSENDKKE